MEDIEGIEFNLAKSLQLFRTIDSLGVTAASFQDTFFETFTTTSLTGEKIELLPGGKEMAVTFHNRHQYCDLIIQVTIASHLQFADEKIMFLSFLLYLFIYFFANKKILVSFARV